jgi:hypothetical protein
VASLSDWKSLYHALIIGIQIGTCLADETDLNLMGLTQSLTSDVFEILASEILRWIDFDAIQEGRVRVKLGVNSELDGLRSQYESLDEMLDTFWSHMFSKFTDITASKLSYFPQIGFLIVIPLPTKKSADYDFDLGNYFSSLSTIYGLEYCVRSLTSSLSASSK